MKTHVTQYKDYRSWYSSLHSWLRRHHGRASYCESENCKKISKRFHWALKKGFEYAYKIENFISLCSSCHRLYDQQEDWITRMAETKKGEIHTKEHRKRIGKSQKGKVFTKEHLENLKQSGEKRKGKQIWGKRKVNAQQVQEMRALYSNGSKNTREIAEQYGLTQATASSIINYRAWKNV